MKDSAAITLFKVIGILHLLWGLLYLCITVLLFMSSFLGEFIETYAGNAGYPIEGLSSGRVWLLLAITSCLVLLYFASSFGFFKMKKWQPFVFTAMILMSAVELFFGFFSAGFSASNFLSMFFLVVWITVLLLVWSKKALFNN